MESHGILKAQKSISLVETYDLICQILEKDFHEFNISFIPENILWSLFT